MRLANHPAMISPKLPDGTTKRILESLEKPGVLVNEK